MIALPGFDRYAQEARTYTLLALAATLSWLLLDSWLRPKTRPTLTSAAPAEPSSGSRRRRVVTTVGYVTSLAAVATIHTFGLFQWPAHALGAMIGSGDPPPACVRRSGSCP